MMCLSVCQIWIVGYTLREPEKSTVIANLRESPPWFALQFCFPLQPRVHRPLVSQVCEMNTSKWSTSGQRKGRRQPYWIKALEPNEQGADRLIDCRTSFNFGRIGPKIPCSFANKRTTSKRIFTPGLGGSLTQTFESTWWSPSVNLLGFVLHTLDLLIRCENIQMHIYCTLYNATTIVENMIDARRHIHSEAPDKCSHAQNLRETRLNSSAHVHGLWCVSMTGCSAKLPERFV